jgi:hypothetical protein
MLASPAPYPLHRCVFALTLPTLLLLRGKRFPPPPPPPTPVVSLAAGVAQWWYQLTRLLWLNWRHFAA